MGGEYEDKVEAPKPNTQAVAPLAGDEVMVQGFRFHLDPRSRKVHFHDDKRDLKVAIAPAVWWGAWQKLRVPAGVGDLGEEFKFHDLDNETLLVVRSELNNGAVTISMSIEPSPAPESYSRVWHALETFTNNTQR